MTPQMKLQRWRPRNEKKWKVDEDGALSAEILTDKGIVGFFSYPGGRHGEPFTMLQIYVWPHIYQCRLPRHYHARWARRLAHDFAHRCWLCAKKDGHA